MRFALHVALILAVLAAPVFAADESPAFEVTGKVLLPDGSPAAGATVDVWYPRDIPAATADASGIFKMSLKRGDYYLRAYLKTLAYKSEEPVQVKKDGTLAKPLGIRLEKGCMVTGKLIDKTTGKPVAGARILTSGHDMAVTQDDGTFAFSALPKGKYTVAVLKDGYYHFVMGFSTTDVDKLDLPLETKPGAVIKGRVTNEKGEPVKGASVGPGGYYFDFEHTTTDENGAYVLAGFDPEGTVEEMSAYAKGYESDAKGDLTFPAGQRELTLDFVLQPEKKPDVRNVTGRVTKEDGTPVEGAKVAYGQNNYSDSKSTRTGKDGAYELKGVGQSRNIVAVQCKGYAPAFGFAEEKVDVKLDFTLESGHRVAGKVVDGKGKPIEGVRISASAQTDVMERIDSFRGAYTDLDSAATTGKDGRFELADLPAEGLLVDVYTSKDFTSRSGTPLKVDKLDHVITLQPHGEIRGKVVTAKDGKPVTRFTVFSGYGMDRGTTFNVPDGVFTISGLDMGQARRLTVEAPGCCIASTGYVQPVPKSKADAAKLVFKLKPTIRFEGTVTAAGAPIEGADVTAVDLSTRGSGEPMWEGASDDMHPARARTDAQGKFSVECPIRRGAITVRKPGWGAVGLTLMDLNKPLSINMEKAASISGVLKDESGKPISQAYLYLHTAHESCERGGAKTGPDGKFSFADLGAGEYVVDFYSTNRARKAHYAEVKAGEDYVVDWVKPGVSTVEGVVTVKGKPVAGAGAYAQLAGVPMSVAVDGTASDGSYRLSLPKPGTYLISVTKGEWRQPDYVNTRKSASVRPGVNHIDIALPGGVVSGVVRDPKTKKPVSGASVSAYHRAWEQEKYGSMTSWRTQHTKPAWWSDKSAKTDKAGRFELVGMEPGEWVLDATWGDGKGRARSGVLRIGRDEEKTGIVLEPGGIGSAEVTVVDARTGEAIRDVFVICTSQSGPPVNPERDPAKPGG